MVHAQYGFILIPHADSMKKLGNPQNRKGICLASQGKSIERDAPDQYSVKKSKRPASVGKQPFLGIPGSFAHQGFPVVFVNAKSKGRQRICDQIHPENVACL